MDVKSNTNRLLMHSLNVKNSSCSQTRLTTIQSFLQNIGLIEAIEALFIILLTFGIIIANILLIFIINNRRYANYIHQQPRYLLTSLALNDLSIGLLITPFGLLPALLHCWPYGEIFCQIQALLRGALSQQSAVILVCMAVDRYLFALYPRRYYQHTSKKGCVAILSITWISSLIVFGVMVLPKGYYFNSTGLMACEPFYNKPSYRILVTCAFYFPTTMVLMYCYGSSFHISQHRSLSDTIKIPLTTTPTALTSQQQQQQQQHIHHHLHHYHHHHQHHDSDNVAVNPGSTAGATTPTNLLPNNPAVNFSMALGTNQLPTQSPTTKILPPIPIKDTNNNTTSHSMAAISLGFIVMVTPWTIQEIVTACTGSKLPRFLDFLVTWMALSNSLWNPSVYWLLNVDFRQLTKELLTFRCRLRSQSSCCHQPYTDYEIASMPPARTPPPPPSSSSSQPANGRGQPMNFGHYHERYISDGTTSSGSILSMCAQHSYTNSLSRSASMNLPPISNNYYNPSYDDCHHTNKLDFDGISEKYWGEILERTVSSNSLLQNAKQQISCTHFSPNYHYTSSSRSGDCFNRYPFATFNKVLPPSGTPSFCQHEAYCAKNQTKHKLFPNDK